MSGRRSVPVPDPASRVLSTAVMLGLHDRILAFYGGQEGLRGNDNTLAMLETLALTQAYSSPTSELAAYYLQDIVQTKPFVAGNRQTAWLCACLVIAKNGEPMVVSDYAQAARIILGAEKGVFTRDELARYFAKLILHGRSLRDSLRAKPKTTRPR